MTMYDKLSRALLGLSVILAMLFTVPSHATIRHQVDWTGAADFTPWPNGGSPPWNIWFQDANAFVYNFGEAGTIQNDVLPQGGNGLAIVHEQDVDDDLNPGTPLNLSLMTISYDITRFGSAPVNTTFGLGLYVYDYDGNGGITATNGDALGLTENGPENNFMNAYLDANPDTPTHYDIKINASGATVDGVGNLKYQVWRDGAFQLEDDLATRSFNPPGTDHPGGYDNGFDAWGFRSFGGGKWEIDNWTIRDNLFMVPEPTSLALLGLGVSMVMLRRRSQVC